MIDRIDAFLKPLDWRARVGMWFAFAILAIAFTAYGLRLASLGPWLGSLACWLMVAASVWMSRKAWPSRLPEGPSLILDRWKSARGKATKTAQGRFAWGLGRSALGAFIALKASSFLPGIGSEETFAAMAGFGVSFGFFGLESAIWGMISVMLVVHVAMSYGLKIDVSDPSARRSFIESWRSGTREISWFWAFGFLLVAPAWISVAATVEKTKKSISRAARKRRNEAIAQRRIEARRKRSSGAPSAGGDSVLDKARAELEEAKARVKQFDRTGSGPGVMDVSSSGTNIKELTGVDKLENEKVVSELQDYATQVAGIRQIEAQGLEVDSPARRSFDRVVLSLSDAHIEVLRVDQSPSAVALYGYYLALCGGEATVLRTGDGELVTSASIAPDEEDAIDGISPGWNMQSAPADELNHDVLDDEDDDEEVEIAPVAIVQHAPAALAASVPEAADREPEPEMMLAPSRAPVHVEPEMGVTLPLKDDVDESQTSSMHEEKVSDPEILPSDRDEDADHGVGGGDVVAMPSAVVDGEMGTGAGDHDDDAEEGSSDLSDDHDDHDDQDRDEEGGEGDHQDGEGQDDGRSDGLDDQPYGDEGSEAVIEPPKPVEDDPFAGIPSSGDASAHGGQVASEPTKPVATPGEMRGVAMKILMLRTPRDLVVQSAGWFDTPEELARAFGSDDEDLTEPFEAYRVKVEAFRSEQTLRSLVESAPDHGEDEEAAHAHAAAIDEAVVQLTSMGWEHDEGLVSSSTEAAASIRSGIEAARVERERRAEAVRAAEEAERQRLLAIETAANEAIRIANEAEAARVEAEAKRIKEEAEAEAEREAAAARAKELEARRGKVAVQIVLGRLTETTIADGTDLFGSVQDFADALDIDLDTAQERFDAFVRARDARLKYRELREAFVAEKVSIVEALLKDEEAFEGYDEGDLSIEDIRQWAVGVRIRERVSGLVDGTKAVTDMGGSSGRQFMMKRTLVTEEIAGIVDESIPKELRIVAKLSAAIESMGDIAPRALHEALAEAKDRAAQLAKRLVSNADHKIKIGEYAAAFLPSDVRVEGEDPWDMLVRMAASAAIDPVSVSDAEEAESAPVVPDALPPVPVAPVEAPIPDRIKVKTPVAFKGARTLEEVQALDIQKEVSRLGTAKFDLDVFFRKQQMALTGHLGHRVSELVTNDGVSMFVTILDKAGQPVGKLRIFTAKLSFVWFDSPSKLWYKDIESGETKVLETDKLERQILRGLSEPNSDPDTVIAVAMMSPIITVDGLTSARPFIDRIGDRFTILSSDDSAGLTSFIDRVTKL